jgi:hypothetical protein
MPDSRFHYITTLEYHAESFENVVWESLQVLQAGSLLRRGPWDTADLFSVALTQASMRLTIKKRA